MSKSKKIIPIFNKEDLVFDSFFESFYPTLVVFAQKYVIDQNIAEDICQDVFLKVYETDKTLQIYDNVKAYLYTLTRNHCLNYIKHAKIKDKYCSQEQLKKEPFFKDVLIEQETYRVLYQAIKTLPKKSKIIMELSLSGMTNAEISDELNVSINTIKSSKLKSYQRLRELLKEHRIAILLLLNMLNS